MYKLLYDEKRHLDRYYDNKIDAWIEKDIEDYTKLCDITNSFTLWKIKNETKKIEIFLIYIYVVYNIMGNMIDYVFMESYSPIRDMVKISYAVGNAKSLKTTSECLKILDMIPSERNFIITHNIAIRKNHWIKNELPISELLCIEGLSECHFIKVNKELHYLIAKANLYASSTMY